ncbi:kinase-like domain-containing protein [Mycena olivaceomarginata]|nr:kinase-like domain-containing protein [Mycena olivaceomarginata]
MERLDKIFHNKQLYTKFLACRGESAQRLLDLLQEILDYASTVSLTNQRGLFKALLRLSSNSKLYPRCFTLPGLQHQRHVAGGSFGDVYTGLLCNQSVAVKMMRVFRESDIDELTKGFGREALIWRQLSHPNLLPFYGLYFFQERLCLVSPWMENGHIRHFLKKETCTDSSPTLQILDVALGLEHLHANGIVHGDLKGDNIFVTPSHRACIADFGLASIVTSLSSLQFTSKPTQGGTVRYQAPEVHKGGHQDQCSDIYSFACLAYEMLTGSYPFQELLMDMAVALAVIGGCRPLCPPSCLGSPSLDSLWNLLQNCWEDNPKNRPVASEIIKHLMGDDIQATRTLSLEDWDDNFTSRFRRQFLDQQPLPTVDELEKMIFGDD